MSSLRFNLILSFSFFISILCPSADAFKSPLSHLTSNGSAIGYLKIKTPENNPYRIYEVAIWAGKNKTVPCSDLSLIEDYSFDPDSIRVFMKSDDEAISAEGLGWLLQETNLTCMRIDTYHNNNHTGLTTSGNIKLSFSEKTNLYTAIQPLVIDLDYTKPQ